MPDDENQQRDASQEALHQIEKITDSEPVQGEELLESEELKRQLAEAKAAKLAAGKVVPIKA
jgi:hypothetical protein